MVIYAYIMKLGLPENNNPEDPIDPADYMFVIEKFRFITSGIEINEFIEMVDHTGNNYLFELQGLI